MRSINERLKRAASDVDVLDGFEKVGGLWQRAEPTPGQAALIN
jgi:hypothetical protein